VRRLLLLTALAVMTIAAASCGGDDTGAEPISGAPRSVEYQLPQKSDIGLHQAFVTFTELDEDSTTVVVEFSVERSAENGGQVYSTGIYADVCAARTDVERDLGELPAGSNTFTVDAPYDDVVGQLEQGASSIAIIEPDGTVGWCGPA
jgi:hypothetical protein